ncbi:MAG: rhomboid family intramembrane serine protease, partial [Salinibacterium sp.]|nr:rhomboid family intramembrane serine protease [Salinibacterium sp.]
MRPTAPLSGLSVTAWIIIINVVVHLLASTIFAYSPSPFGYGRWSRLHDLGHFSTAKAFFDIQSDGKLILNLQVWRFVTFQFLHDLGSIWHIVLNMFGLWIFGRTVEQYLGGKKYLAFYLVCGIFGALLYLLLNLLGSMGLHIPGVMMSDPHTPL